MDLEPKIKSKLSPLVNEFIPKAQLAAQSRGRGTKPHNQQSRVTSRYYSHNDGATESANTYMQAASDWRKSEERSSNWRRKANGRLDSGEHGRVRDIDYKEDFSRDKPHLIDKKHDKYEKGSWRQDIQTRTYSPLMSKNLMAFEETAKVADKHHAKTTNDNLNIAKLPNANIDASIKSLVTKSDSQSADDESKDDSWIQVRSRSRREDKDKSRQNVLTSVHSVVKTKNKTRNEVEIESLTKEMGSVNVAGRGRQSYAANRRPVIQETEAVAVVENVPGNKVPAKAEKKKKRKTNAQRREDHQNKLKRLPSTHGKVFTVTSDMFQFISKGEQVPRILRRTDVTEQEPDLGQANFPLLGQEPAIVKSTDYENDSGWSDVETTVVAAAKSNSKPEEFPQLGANSTSKLSASTSVRSYSTVFKKVAMNNHLEGDLNVVSGTSSSRRLKSNNKVSKQVQIEPTFPSAPVSVKPKSNSLIKLDIVNMLQQRQESTKSRPASNLKVKKMVKIKPVVANILDSSAPARRRGKERETPRKKKPTTMKKIILKERQERKLARCRQPVLQETNAVDCETETIHQETNADNCETETIKQSHLDDVGDTVNVENERVTPLIEAPVTETQGQIRHSRKFREYCHQTLCPEIDEVATKLIQDLIRFHDKVYQKDPVKAKMRRRMVIGLKEITKHLKLKRIKCLILAPNLERISNQGGLDDAMGNIISLAEESNVPVIFALNRRKLGRVCLKKVPVSGVGIFNYDGSEVNYKKLIDLAEEGHNVYVGKQSEVDSIMC